MAPIPLPVDPRLLDPRLWLRALDDLHKLSEVAVVALDDLHAIAEIAHGLAEVEARLTARLEAVERTLEEAVGIARRLLAIDARAVELLGSIDRVDAHAARLLATVEEVGSQLPVAHELLDAARVLNGAATTLATAVEPLQGAIERLGRITDRLPRGRPARGG